MTFFRFSTSEAPYASAAGGFFITLSWPSKRPKIYYSAHLSKFLHTLPNAFPGAGYPHFCGLSTCPMWIRCKKRGLLPFLGTQNAVDDVENFVDKILSRQVLPGVLGGQFKYLYRKKDLTGFFAEAARKKPRCPPLPPVLGVLFNILSHFVDKRRRFAV